MTPGGMKALLGAALCAVPCVAAIAGAADAHWVAAWYSPPLPPTAVWGCNQVRTFSHQTVRQVVQLEAAGDRLRIRLTNELGLEPLSFADVHVALSSPNGVTEPGQAPGLASGVDVAMATPHRVLVAFGDSITEGTCATEGTHRDYPEQLAHLLAAQRGSDQSWVVIDSGISGNRLLHDGTGPKAPARFERDALDIAGVKTILLLEGINDIGWAFDPAGDGGPLSAADIIGVYQDLIRRAHARGIEIFLGTLAPYEGAKYSHPQGEKVREAVNAWIRKGAGFDGVVDFEAVLRDPASPLQYLGADQCGDDLHPNDAGYHAMAHAAFQRLFAP